MKTLADIEREARATRHRIAELDGLTQKFDQALVRSETERDLHLAKIAGEQDHLAELIDAAALIVQHLGAEVPVDEPVVAMADSPQDEVALHPVDALEQVLGDRIEPEQYEELRAICDEPVEATPEDPTFEYVAAAVEQIAGSPPGPDASDEPEMTDEQVERAEQTLAAVDHIGAAGF